MGLNKKTRRTGKKRHYSKKRGRKTHHHKRRTVRNLGGDKRSDLQQEIKELKELREQCRQNLDEKIAKKRKN